MCDHLVWIVAILTIFVNFIKIIEFNYYAFLDSQAYIFP